MATKNYFSGCEGKQHFEAVVKADAEHCLQSYLYIRKQHSDLIKDRKKKYPHMRFMVDSGAHTMMDAYAAKFGTWTVKDFEEYCIAYRDWLLLNKDYIDVAVELDIEFCINRAAGRPDMDDYGVKVVKEWQDKYFRPLEEKGLPIIFCWHEPRGMEGWEEMCSEFSYVGLPGKISSLPDFNKFVTTAKRYTTRMHGFAATKQSDFRDWPWYSIDSTSWKDSERYGVLLHWDEHRQKFIYEQDKTKYSKYRSAMIKYGLPADDIIAGKNYKAFTIFALISMTLMEKFYERIYSSRTFYYELRLPHPKLIYKLPDSQIKKHWEKMRGAELFKQHPDGKKERRDMLYWLSLVQYRDKQALVNPRSVGFLNTYFGAVLGTNPNDIQGVQKALANFIAPPNPPPIPRSDLIPTNNPPKEREPIEFSLSDLEWSEEELDEYLDKV